MLRRKRAIPGGGSGRVARVLSLCLSVLVAPTILAAGPAQDAYNHCTSLGGDNWRPVSASGEKWTATVLVKDRQTFLEVMPDGIAIASLEPRDLNPDWKNQTGRAEYVATRLTTANEPSKIRTYVSPGTPASAALAIMREERDGWEIWRCLYSGSTDAQITAMMDTVADMDAIAGVKMAPPEVQLAVITSDAATAKYSAQLSRYMPGAQHVLGREPRVELGMSIIFARRMQ